MKAYLVRSPVGIFALGKDKSLLTFKLFDKNPKKIAEKLKSEGLTMEEKFLLNELKKRGTDEVVLQRKVRLDDFCVKVDAKNEVFKFFKQNFRRIVIKDLKVFENDEALNEFLSLVGIELTKMKIKESVGKDSLVAQAINAWEEVNKTINVHVERLREWYGIYFPEMEKGVGEHRKFVELVAKYGKREEMPEKWRALAEDSIGIDLNDSDVQVLQKFAKTVQGLYELRERLEKYIDELLREVAPNLREIAGSMIAAKLIEAAGGLEKLAKMPSSTIQLLGAEKALFRFLRGKGKSPKYGFIFMTSYIQRAPRKKHGKIARLVAAKLAIAAKLDFYGKEYRGDELKKDLEKKINEVLKK
ncbi:MAG: hypothetical protein J7K98_04325 [Candidatus Aenigmarchaeota archaeon]|nr:hypothetical protein [Candidatus Aenigmarchaeota archaeon]